MAVTVGHEDVNGGNAGWTKKDVMDALETVFKNIQYHSDTGLGVGNSKTGVPNFVWAPNLEIGEGTNYFKCGGKEDANYAFPYPNVTAHGGNGSDPRSLRHRFFQPKPKTGNTAYYMMEYWCVSSVDDSTNEINLKGGYSTNSNINGGNDVLVDDKPVVWRPDGSGTDFGALVCGTTYYVIRVDTDTIKLAATAGGAAISLTGTTLGSGSFGYPDAIIREPQDATTENVAIQTKKGDNLWFDFPASDGADFKLWHGYKSDITNNVTPYAASKEIDVANVDRFNPSWDNAATNGTSARPQHLCYTGYDGNYGPWPTRSATSVYWSTYKWAQTETIEPDSFFVPDWLTTDTVQGSRNIIGGQQYSDVVNSQEVISRYYYGHASNTGMVGEIVIAPCSSQAFNESFVSQGNQDPYWDYTVAGDGAGVTGGGGAGKNLTLRIARHPKFGKITKINIVNMTDGWSDNAVFTIPGEDIGGDATLNDLTFGVNANESATNEFDGTPSLAVTNFGGDQGFFQKSNAGTFAVLARDHSSTSKKRSRTFYSFSFPYGTDTSSNKYTDSLLFINSGISYSVKNRPGITYDSPNGTVLTNNQDSPNMGIFTGDWTDIQNANCTPRRDAINYRDQWSYVIIAGKDGPTSNPLRIYYTRADSPQDTNFATITFVQYSNSVPEVYGTMVLPGGDNFMEPSPGVDLDELYHATLVTIGNGSDKLGTGKGSIPYLTVTTKMIGYDYYHSSGSISPLRVGSTPRNSLFGYMRDRYTGGTTELSDYYNTTILRSSTDGAGPRLYHRDSTNDEVPGVDWYKPIKGIPMSTCLAPVPYYFPDDYALIQFSVSPGNTEFRYGDTITIGTSPNEEKYMVIVPAYDTNSRDWTKADTPAYTQCQGVLFCARVAI
tara:strand:+ start:2092 stop:4761 length:2670 start_codon:yes stop_codon:yes gene_type:complete